jgi:hypothetical protein
VRHFLAVDLEHAGPAAADAARVVERERAHAQAVVLEGCIWRGRGGGSRIRSPTVKRGSSEILTHARNSLDLLS